MDSVIWLPIFITGLSDVIGSWNTIAISVPQMPRITSGEAPVMSCASYRTVPVTSALLGSSPMIERERTVLPDPDSPTMPSVLPRSIVKVTPSTAPTSPRGVRNCVLRSVTSSSAPVPGSARGDDPTTRATH